MVFCNVRTTAPPGRTRLDSTARYARGSATVLKTAKFDKMAANSWARSAIASRTSRPPTERLNLPSATASLHRSRTRSEHLRRDVDASHTTAEIEKVRGIDTRAAAKVEE